MIINFFFFVFVCIKGELLLGLYEFEFRPQIFERSAVDRSHHYVISRFSVTNLIHSSVVFTLNILSCVLCYCNLIAAPNSHLVSIYACL